MRFNEKQLLLLVLVLLLRYLNIKNTVAVVAVETHTNTHSQTHNYHTICVYSILGAANTFECEYTHPRVVFSLVFLLCVFF